MRSCGASFSTLRGAEAIDASDAGSRFEEIAQLVGIGRHYFSRDQDFNSALSDGEGAPLHAEDRRPAVQVRFVPRVEFLKAATVV